MLHHLQAMKMILLKFFSLSNLHIQRSKFGGKFDKFGGKSVKKMNPAKFMKFVFSKSGRILPFSKIDRTLESAMQFRCPSRFRM